MLRIYLFGKFSIQQDSQELLVLEARKLQEFLGYLLLDAGRPHSRENLAGLFWGDSTTTQSKKNLRQVLWQIQSELEPLRQKEAPPFLEVDNDWVQVQVHEGLWVDCFELEKAYRLCRNVPGEQISLETYSAMRMAVELYKGDLLEGCYQDWCIFERERLQNIYLDLLGRLIEYCLINGEYQAGIEYGKLVLTYDWTHETTYRQMMQLYYLLGDRSAALRQYNRCCEALQKEFEAAPSRLTTKLYWQIRGDGGGPAPSPLASFGPTSNSITGEGYQVKETVERLNQIQLALAGLQVQIREQVQALESLLKEIL
jgi:two-component SAPR family response regulator